VHIVSVESHDYDMQGLVAENLLPNQKYQMQQSFALPNRNPIKLLNFPQGIKC